MSILHGRPLWKPQAKSPALRAARYGWSVVYGKVGTMSGEKLVLRKVPRIGGRVQFKRIDNIERTQWETGVCDLIKDDGQQKIYFISLF